MHLDYQLIDADSHYYEPDDCFTRHIEKRYADRVVHVVRGESPHARVYIGQDRLNFFSSPPGEVTGSPGSLYEFLRSGGEGGDHMIQNPLHGLDVPEFVNRDARLRWMDSHDVEASLLLPSLGVGVEHQLRHDSGATFANLRVQSMDRGRLGIFIPQPDHRRPDVVADRYRLVRRGTGACS